MIKAFAFDLDGTLTQHNAVIEENNRKILEKLSNEYKLVIVSASSCECIYNQLGGFPAEAIGNYGMQNATYENGKISYKRNEKKTCESKEYIEKTVTAIREKHGMTSYVGNNVEFLDTGCMVFPILGAEADENKKLAFDPDRSKRRAILDEVYEAFGDYNVFLGGSSCFDIAPKPFNKYYALDKWCSENGLSHDEVIFVGDDYGLGGNDECVYHSDFRFITIDDYKRLGEVLAPWLNERETDVAGLLGAKSDCSCGSLHNCNIENVIIRNGAVNELPAMCKKYKSILLVSDSNTYRVCGERVDTLLANKITSRLKFEGEGVLIPDENAVEMLKSRILPDTDLIVGVGSGVINDLCKHVSFEAKLPYYIVATAPSMDGYASKGAAMLFGGMKITTNAAVPTAIIADTSVLKDAPLEMLKAGYGDIIGKYSCLNDWRLSEAVNGEPLCRYVYDLTYNTVESVSKMGRDILSRDENCIAFLMRALVIVGIAMAYMGNSRPASGSEHHLSHFFEVIGVLRSEPYFSHGIDVAYSTYVTACIRRDILKMDSPKTKSFDESAWENEIRRVYGYNGDQTVSDGVIETQKRLGWIYEDKSSVYEEKWDEIKKILSESPTPEEILFMLESAELSMDDFYDLYSKEKIDDAIIYAKDLKDRYTVLWLNTALDK